MLELFILIVWLSGYVVGWTLCKECKMKVLIPVDYSKKFGKGIKI